MARVSATEVKSIMDNVTLDNTVIDVYIKGANLLVTDVFSGDTDIGTDLLKEIERWLTAHMIASTRWRLAKRERVGDAEIEYTGTFRQDLSSTPYGQMVKQLDTTGKLENAGKRAASIYAVKQFDD